MGRSVIPKYRKRADGYGFVEHHTIGTKSHRMTLGRYGSEESKQRYREFLEQLQLVQVQAITPGKWLTIDDLAQAYLVHARTYYMRSYGLSTQYGAMRAALAALEDYGGMSVNSFNVSTLVQIRSRLAKSGYKRSSVNDYLSRIKKFFRWCCQHELAPPELYHKLLCVKGLARGQDNCAEPSPVTPAEYLSLKRVLPFVSVKVGVILRVQYWSGMRPGEACILRAQDIDQSWPTWLFRPQRHKTEWRGFSAVKAIPIRAQRLLRPFLDNKPYLFHPGRKRTHYTPDVLRRALERGFDKASLAGVKLEPFTPNQLRHSIATRISQELGEQAAQVWLGHETLRTTGLYVERQEKALLAVASQVERSLNASA